MDLKNSSKECPDGECMATVNIGIVNDTNSIRSRKCVKSPGRKQMGLYFELSFDLNFGNSKSQLQYYCNYKNCNSRKTVNAISTKLNEYFNPTLFIDKFKNINKSEEVQETTTILASSQQQTSLVDSTSDENIILSSSISQSYTSETTSSPYDESNTQANHASNIDKCFYFILMIFFLWL